MSHLLLQQITRRGHGLHAMLQANALQRLRLDTAEERLHNCFCIQLLDVRVQGHQREEPHLVRVNRIAVIN